MRIGLLAAALWWGGNVLACAGGKGDREGPKDPAGAASPEAASLDGKDAEHAGSATTTTALGDERATPGRKLDETRPAPASSPAGPATNPATAAHTHDAGRRPADIRAMVVAHRDHARTCYDKSLATHPGIEGDLVLQWTIDPKGSVTQVSADASRSQIAEPTLIACVADVIKSLQFAPSPGGFETRAFYPFNFHPKHAARQPDDGGL